MENIGWLFNNLFKIPFIIVAFIIYLPVFILDLIWNLLIEEKPVYAKAIIR